MQDRVSSFIGQLTDASGSITAGGTAQTVVAADLGRRYFLFQNISDTVMYLNFATAATDNSGTPNSIKLAADAAIIFEFSFLPWQSVSVMCATTGKKFICKVA